MATTAGKRAENKIKEWLNRPEDGYCFDRIPDQLGGYYGSANVSDFLCFKSPYMFYIESKETQSDNFAFGRLSDIQYYGMLEKSKVENVFGIVIILFSEHHRAFIFKIQDIDNYVRVQEKKSVNIKKIDSWTIPYVEIPTVPSRKIMWDYKGELDELVLQIPKA